MLELTARTCAGAASAWLVRVNDIAARSKAAPVKPREATTSSLAGAFSGFCGCGAEQKLPGCDTGRGRDGMGGELARSLGLTMLNTESDANPSKSSELSASCLRTGGVIEISFALGKHTGSVTLLEAAARRFVQRSLVAATVPSKFSCPGRVAEALGR